MKLFACFILRYSSREPLCPWCYFVCMANRDLGSCPQHWYTSRLSTCAYSCLSHECDINISLLLMSTCSTLHDSPITTPIDGAPDSVEFIYGIGLVTFSSDEQQTVLSYQVEDLWIICAYFKPQMHKCKLYESSTS